MEQGHEQHHEQPTAASHSARERGRHHQRADELRGLGATHHAHPSQRTRRLGGFRDHGVGRPARAGGVGARHLLVPHVGALARPLPAAPPRLTQAQGRGDEAPRADGHDPRIGLGIGGGDRRGNGGPRSAPTEMPTVYSPTERIADADRERAVEELREHMLVGRLTAEEFEDRLGSAHAARTRADLDAVRVDLPMSPAALSERRAP